MGSQFDASLRLSGSPVLMQHQGEPVVYRSPGGDETQLTAIAGDEERDARDAGLRDIGNQLAEAKRRRVKIMRDPASPYGGVPEPDTAGVVLIGGVEWSIDACALGDHDAILSLVRYDIRAVARRGHYRTL